MGEKIDPTELDNLAFKLELAKQAEANAEAVRIEIEEELLTCATIELKGEGSKTYNENYFKVVVKEPISRAVDTEAYMRFESKHQEELGLLDLVKVKYSLNASAHKELEKRKPVLFKEFSKCITSKPGKVQVSVERRKKN